MDVKDDNGDTPLHLAATEGRLLALFSLVKRGAPITKNKRRKTPRDLMKKTSSRDGPGIELFRGVSMVRIMIIGIKVVQLPSFVLFCFLYAWLWKRSAIILGVLVVIVIIVLSCDTQEKNSIDIRNVNKCISDRACSYRLN